MVESISSTAIALAELAPFVASSEKQQRTGGLFAQDQKSHVAHV